MKSRSPASRTVLALVPLILSHVEFTAGLSVYPWGQSLQQRSETILAELRETLSLDIHQEWLPEPLRTSPQSSLVFTNVEGEEYLCSIAENDASKGNDPRSDDKHIPMHFFDSELLSSKLLMTCSTMTLDYWTYEWCHRRSISQFHIVSNHDTSFRNPDWSLGRYLSSTVIRERNDNNNMSAAIVRLVDTFDNGQWCDETGSPRKSEVRIECCDHAPPKRNIRNSMHQSERHPNEIAYVASIFEPEFCSYKITVCSKIMCHPKVTSSAPKPKVTLRSVLQELQGKCVTKQEDWWTYEICFGKSVRQFRVQATPQSGQKVGDVESEQGPGNAPAGKPKPLKMIMKIVSEFNLGTTESDDSDLHSRVVHKQEGVAIGLTGKLVNNSMATVSMDFSNGTSCDLKDTSRASRVDLICGEALGHKNIDIIDITEDSTCHYVFKVSVPGLCELDMFSPKIKEVSTIDCFPVSEMLESTVLSSADDRAGHDPQADQTEDEAMYLELDSSSGVAQDDVDDTQKEVRRRDDLLETEIIDGESVPLAREGDVGGSQQQRVRMARRGSNNHIKFQKQRERYNDKKSKKEDNEARRGDPVVIM